MKKEIQKLRIEKLREEVKKHDLLYSKREPIISDSDYDDLYMELVELERKLGEKIPEDSPTQKIYVKLVDELEKIKHSRPMLSQEKIRTEEDILDFYNKLAIKNILIQEKLDGLTIVITYKDGILKQAVTRGDGEIGEIVTHNILTVKSLPKRINYKGELIIRAEAILPFAEFNRIIETEDYKNPRNLASGTIRQLDASIANERNLEVIVFDLIKAENKEFKKDTEQLNFLKTLGFNVVDFVEYNEKDDITKITNYCLTYNEKIRPNLDYLVDGLVLKANDLSERKTLGSTSKHPKWACAFKFEAVEAITTIKNVTFQVGKTGAITPVAELEPVSLEGSTISRATLHNMEYIREKDIHINDKVIIIKSGDVIPKVVKVIKSERKNRTIKEINITHCPDCSKELTYKVKADGGMTSDLFCVNPDCPSQNLYKIIHFISRSAMNVDGLGEETVKTLIDNNLIYLLDDLYFLKDKKETFIKIDGFGLKKFEKIIDSLEESKEKSLSKVLYALSIPSVGIVTAKKLAKKYKSMENLLKRVNENEEKFLNEVSNMKDLGDAVAYNLNLYLKQNKNGLIKRLFDIGFIMEEETNEVKENTNISGKVFVVTGKLNTYNNRKELVADIEKFGGKVTKSVSSNTNYLINNDINSTSSKNKKAKKIGIPIISETEYNELKKEA